MARLSRRDGSGLISEECPLPDELITRLYHAAEDSIVEIAQTLSPEQRTSLALFCYSRAHLHDIGLTLAQSCDEHSLIAAAGGLGRAILQQSRERMAATKILPPRGRKPISLAKLAPSPHAPFADLDDDAVTPPEAS